MAHPYRELFEPVSIGRMHLRNRIAMPPMFTRFAGENGEVSDREIAYMEERAKGGVGLIVVENTCIDWDLGRGVGNPVTIHDDRYRTCLNDLVFAVHRHGAKIVTQLHHAGRQNLRSNITGGGQPIGPSAVHTPLAGDPPRAMTEEEIERAIAQYAAGARRTKECGFDGVELHGAHGYLLTEFISPFANRRTDKWGGPFENRCRFGVEVIRAIRRAVGPDFPILFRYSADEKYPGGLQIEEGVRYAKVLEGEGVDAFDVSAGNYDSPIWTITPQGTPLGMLLPLAAAVKAEVRVPVIAVSSLGLDPALACEVIRSGQADLVHMGRSLLCDPQLPNKLREDRAYEVRQCIRCNECLHNLDRGWRIACVINAELGHEYRRLVQPAPVSRRIVVVGAGPAGLEYAVTAARRGHRVTVLEQADRIGGQVNLAARPAYKTREMGGVPAYYAAMLKKHGIDLRLGTPATPETVAPYNPDLVVLAVGSRPMRLPVPGGERAMSAAAVLAEDARGVGQRVAVVGGSGVGLDVAMFLSDRGKTVTVLEMADEVGADLHLFLRLQLKEMMAARGIECLTGHRVTAVTEHGVTVQAGGAAKEMAFDTVVAAVGFECADTCEMEAALCEAGYPVRTVGTCIDPGHLLNAVHGGFWAALED